MKVLILSYFFPPCTSGAGAVMYDLCTALPRSSYYVLTVRREFCIKWGAYDENYQVDCDMQRLPVYTDSTLSRTVFFFLAILQGWRIIRKKKVDSIFAVYPFITDVLAAYILSRLTRKPFVVQMHDVFSEKKNGLSKTIWEIVEKSVLSKASRTLVMTEFMKGYFSRKGIPNTVVFPTPIDQTKINSPSQSRTQEDNRSLKIVFTGQVYKVNESAIRAFLDAVKGLDNLKIMFALASADHLRQDLKDYLKDVNVGSLTKEKCRQLQRSADVLFLPGSPEVWYNSLCYPCKVNEYLLAGKPILAVIPRGSYIEHFLKKYDLGVIVTVHSAERIVTAVEELRDHEKREHFSRNALRTAQLFDARKVGKQLCVLLEDVACKS